MNITQLINTGPAKALELFAKLAETSDGALKTRERLMDDLTSELQLYAELEQKHLLPVLRKHKETRELARDTTAGHRQTLQMLNAVAETPKDSPEFLTSLTDLQRQFQQHVRSEKKQLPMMRQALGREELDDVIAHVEGGRAEAEEARLEQAEQRRNAAREERAAAQREQEESERRERQREAAGIRRAVVRQRAEEAEQAEQKQAAAEQARQQAAAAERKTAELADKAVQRVGAAAARRHRKGGTSAIYGEVWMDFASSAALSATRATAAMAQSRSPAGLVQAHMRYSAEMTHAWKQAGERLMQLALGASSRGQ